MQLKSASFVVHGLWCNFFFKNVEKEGKGGLIKIEETNVIKINISSKKFIYGD